MKYVQDKVSWHLQLLNSSEKRKAMQKNQTEAEGIEIIKILYQNAWKNKIHLLNNLPV